MILRLATSVVVLVLVGCAGGRPPTLTPLAPAAGVVVAVVYLVGDAGVPAVDDEPVFDALMAEIAEGPAGPERRIVFLGDNIYPRGLPAPEAPSRGESERRIASQVQVALDSSTPTIFVPGNHDWDKSGADGWNAVRRLAELVEAMGEGLVEFLPRGGCPGPEVRDVGERVRLVFLDTEWWLREGDKPRDPSSDCSADAETEILDQLGDAIDTSEGRHVVVAAHHPLATGGPHGGHFTFLQHIFPLRDWKSWLWIPLPVIGSIYPLARMNGITDQDLSGGRNQAMREALDSAFAAHPPLVYANGHTHGLEVLDGSGRAGVIVTSGAGNFGHVSSLSWLAETRFTADRGGGYVKLEFERDGRVRLSVVTVDQDARRTEAFATYVESPRE